MVYPFNIVSGLSAPTVAPLSAPQAAVIALASFVFTVETSNTSTGSSNSDQFSLPLISAGTYAFTVDWGDGSSDDITAWDDAAKTHTYSSAGEYTVTITGTFEGWRFNNSGDRLKLLTVESWGPFSAGPAAGGHFYGASNWTTVPSNESFDTAGMTNMFSMFRDCSSLTSLDVSGFDTSSVTNMGSMFRGSSLTSLDVSGFDTSSVTNMGSMFRGSSLTSLDVSGFDTSSVTNMGSMFRGSSLTSLDVSGFDTSSVTNMANMFRDCSSLTSLDVSFDTAGMTNMFSMFRDCSSLTSLDVSGFDTAGATNMGSMFRDCSSLTSLDVSGFDTAGVTNMANMFRDCSSLNDDTRVDIFDVTALTQADNFMNGATALSTARYDATLIAWEGQAVNNNVSVHFGTAQYTSGGAAEAARTALVNDHSWTITDGGAA